MFSGVLTVKAALDRACRWHSRNAALIEGERVVTYDEFAAQCRRIANGYRKLGAVKGDRIVYLCHAGIDHAIAYYAGHYMGAITANLHFRETARHQLELARRLGPKFLVHDAEKRAAARQIAEALPGLQTVCLGERCDCGSISLAELLSAPDNEPEVEVLEHDQAVIQLSSGSTGAPKALVHTHRSVLETWSGGIYMWSGIEPHDRFLNAFSPSFAVWLVHPGAFLNHGAAVVFQRRWEPGVFLQTAARFKVTCAALSAAQWRAVLGATPEAYDLSTLRMAAYLGEKMSPEHLRELTRRITPSFCGFYGMSECLGLGGCVIRSSDCLKLNKWASVGKPSLNSDLRVAQPGGLARDPKGPGEVGEIVVRAASFAIEDWGNAGWRERVLTPDGWYRTGDLGFVDQDGYVHLVGRVDSMITTGGIKVAPEEIEQVLESHPDVAEAAVTGAADQRWGERIVAFVVARRPGLTADELAQWCRNGERLAGFKCPKEWVFLDRLPQNSAGKRDRRSLHQFLPELNRAGV
ncbi:MAG: acyl--CoA ligase [Deltaproteobacteria bacterium]|jgi:fatty-acyl-CoA synthase|nr:acyl--CoA ligase [Deltaproteobacteria bacterium]